MSSVPPPAAALQPKPNSRPRFPKSRSTPAQFPVTTLLAWQVPLYAITGGLSSLPGQAWATQMVIKSRQGIKPSWPKTLATGFGAAALRFGVFAASRTGIQAVAGASETKHGQVLQAGAAGLVAGGVEGLAFGSSAKAALISGPRIGITFGVYTAMCNYSPVVSDQGPVDFSSANLYGLVSAAIGSAVMYSFDPRGSLFTATRLGVVTIGLTLGLQTMAVEAMMGC